MRTFITVISMQGTLKKTYYRPVNFQLEANRESAFPIIPVIAEEHGKSVDGKDEIIVIMQKNRDTERNYGYFLEELGELGLSEDIVKVIELPEDQSTDNGINMIVKIMENVSDNSDVYACITYGTKVVSILLTFALLFLEKLKTNCQVQGMYYGEILRVADKSLGDGKLYNLVANLRLSRVVDQLEQMELSQAEKYLKVILGVD